MGMAVNYSYSSPGNPVLTIKKHWRAPLQPRAPGLQAPSRLKICEYFTICYIKSHIQNETLVDLRSYLWFYKDVPEGTGR